MTQPDDARENQPVLEQQHQEHYYDKCADSSVHHVPVPELVVQATGSIF